MTSVVVHVNYLYNMSLLIPMLTEKLVQTKLLSKGMATKIAGSGLSYRHLQLAFRRDKDCGLQRLLGEVTNGKVRVTKSARIIDSLAQHFGAC